MQSEQESEQMSFDSTSTNFKEIDDKCRPRSSSNHLPMIEDNVEDQEMEVQMVVIDDSTAIGKNM